MRIAECGRQRASAFPIAESSGSARTASRSSRTFADSRRKRTSSESLGRSRRTRAPAIRSCSCSSATAAATARTPRSAFRVPISRARDFAQLLGAIPDAESRVRQPDERERRHAARSRGAEPRHHHRDQELVRAQRIAVRAVLRRRADARTSPTPTRTAAISLLEAFRYAVDRDEARLRDRHASSDRARAARRHGHEGGRRRARRKNGPGPARATVLPRRRPRPRRRRTIRSSPRCTRTGSRSRTRSIS